jgi:hypothetical protein
MLATTDIVVEPVALNMRYALAPFVAVSVGGTQMSDERLLRQAGTDDFFRSTSFCSTGSNLWF